MKNIVVFIDGTNQDRSKQELKDMSNVARLHEACRHLSQGNVVQKVRYCKGVGTDVHESFSGGAFGIGLEKRITEGYLFLQQEVGIAKENTEPFKIFLFGFSRGAFAVRWLAEVVAFSGIPVVGQSERPGILNLWRHDKDSAKKLRESGLQYDVDVEMIGVWDTVQSTTTEDFGVKDLPANATTAYHATALDEFRSKFPVTRFNPRKGVRELWFAGCHTDVGGGYSDGRLTADTALRWMVDMAKPHGLLVDDPKLDLGRQDSMKPEIHDELKAKGFMGFVWRFTNWIRGVKHKVRLVEAGDYLHPTVNLWKEQHKILHEQDISNCYDWKPNDSQFMIA